MKEELLEAGLPKDTPAAVVYKATWPDERIVRTSLEQLPRRMKEAGIEKTALIVVGRVLDGAYERSRLYDGSFATGFRKAEDAAGKGDGPCGPA